MGQADLKRHVARVHRRLQARHGPARWGSPTDPVALLVETILSHNTNDRNRDVAYCALRAAYPDWQAVLQADPAALASVVRPAGLNHQKAHRIQFALRTLLDEFGALTLEPLRAQTADEARAWLTRLPGVGKKTAGIVLTFGLSKPYFAVDTHINRIARRLGWVGPRQDPHDVMNALVAPDDVGPFHLQLIRHGRTTCKARKPLCQGCAISDLCPTFQREQE